MVSASRSVGSRSPSIAGIGGDVVATASPSPVETELLATFRFDEFGNPEQSKSLLGGSAEYGWLGSKGRRTQLSSGVIQMGVRSYVPALGRFLTPDPVQGGSANAYDYAFQDPNLTGECAHPGHGKCYGPPAPAWAKKAARKANKRGAIVTRFKTRRGAERFMHTWNMPANSSNACKIK